MSSRRGRLPLLAALCATAITAWAFQKPFREYPGQEYNDFPVPPDYRDKTEFIFARLMYPDGYGGFGFSRRFADQCSAWRLHFAIKYVWNVY